MTEANETKLIDALVGLLKKIGELMDAAAAKVKEDK